MPELRLSPTTDNSGADSPINLGAESPSSILKPPSNDTTPRGEPSADVWAKYGIAPTSDLPTRPREWRSNSFTQKQKDHPPMKKEIDRDCGICFEVARTGCRTPCCRSLFCLEHITDWLNGPSSDGKCPSCKTPCTIKNGSITVIARPHLELPPATPYDLSPVPSPYSGPHETTVDVNPIDGP
ncbi:hypothetical protein BDP27DRAFT_1327015 [Rhodocollybia butyracea]|uniref:RING-type domain-containing protein n=1 Tax=Rhodocollybia butyracea TaxID=206335 RepID=A0A9P5PU85_9AGAR|nr:hypothetical protein BDP27DRAFT_1327015 [Rhodocollybia butyracea]